MKVEPSQYDGSGEKPVGSEKHIENESMLTTVPWFQTPKSSETPALFVTLKRGVPDRETSRSTVKPARAAFRATVSTSRSASYRRTSCMVVLPDHCLPDEHGSRLPVGIW